MKVYTCTMTDPYQCDTILGVFSSRDKGIEQAELYMQGLGEMYEEVDRDLFLGVGNIYYETIRFGAKYMAVIEEFELDELSP